MKIKTSELIGAALDWAVAMANGLKPEDVYIDRLGPSLYRRLRAEDGALTGTYRTGPELLFSQKWESGGPIVELEIGNLWKHNKLNPSDPDVWTAAAYRKAPDGTLLYYEEGPTPLVAAMRCFVSSKLGDEVDIPDELITKENPQCP